MWHSGVTFPSVVMMPVLTEGVRAKIYQVLLSARLWAECSVCIISLNPHASSIPQFYRWRRRGHGEMVSHDSLYKEFTARYRMRSALQSQAKLPPHPSPCRRGLRLPQPLCCDKITVDMNSGDHEFESCL